MAVQDAKNFLDAVDQDPDLRAQVKGSFDQVVQTAKQRGYDVSWEDLADEIRTRAGMTRPPSSYHGEPDTCTCDSCIPV
jgi:predicted ribosomally synthesized peptide with nif11-like leader